MSFSEDNINQLIKGVYRGDVDTDNLPEDLYFAIANALKQSLYEGFGGTIEDFEGKPLALLKELRENIYMFSGAKTYQQVGEMTQAVADENGKVPFKEFFEKAKSIYNEYNVYYARTEQDTAFASAQQGAKWIDIVEQSNVLPYLQMSVVEDVNTTEICQPLEGITLPVNDPFWDTYYPPNHWNCRSTVLQLDEATVSSKSDVAHAEKHADEDMQDVFKMNVGKDGYVFSPDHPYYDVQKKDIAYAQNNFNLPIPEDD
jgi:SPP1 gp7 family putative phage head morphogenesis protein